MKTKVFILCFAILACIVLLLNNASSVVYDVCEAMSDEEVSYDEFQVLIESIYNGECNEAMNVKTTFSMSKDDFSELAYTYDIIDSEGNPLVFFRTGTPSAIGIGAILVYGNDGDFPVKLGDRLHIWTSGTPKDIIIELSIEGCDPYDDECDAICSYEDDYVCDPLCYVHNKRDNIQCDIDCVDQNNNHIVDEGDLDGICDPDCYNDDLDPKRAYDPDCVDVDNEDGICDPDSQGIRDRLCDPDCAPANHLCDFDCNGTTHPGNPHGYNDTDCYVCDGICNGFCSYDCAYLDHDPDCPEGFTDWFELAECCGNNNCGMSENCQSCPRDCPEDDISVDPPVEKNCSIFNEGPGDNFFCCPDANNSAMYGCANLTLNKQENESCTCQPECADGLVCNGPPDDKHCCPQGYKWDGSMCKMLDPCLTESPKGSGVDFSGAVGGQYPVQKYTSSAQAITMTPAVMTAVATALAEGVNNHPEWGISNPDELDAAQRLQAIFEWETANMGYLYDNSELCKCSSVVAAGWNCVSGDVWLSGDDTLIYTPPCRCHPDTICGDCDDYAHLYISMARTAGISEECVAWKCGPGHAFNAAKINGKWEYVDAQGGQGASWSQMLQSKGYSCGGYGAHSGYTDYDYHDICGK